MRPMPDADPNAPPKKLSPVKWLAGFLFFVAVMVVSGALGIWLSGGPRRPMPPTVAPVNVPVALFVIFAFLGGALAFAGAVLYGLMLLTDGFTFGYARPVLTRFKVKQWLGNLVVGMLVHSGLALMMAPALLALLLPVMPMYVAGMLAFFGPFVLLQLFSTWIQMWPGVMRSITAKRLMYLGVPREALAAGVFIGTSDPAKNSFRKMSLIEEDVGVLWLNPAGLSYRGDTTAWDIPRERVVGIERKADAGSVSAYFGAVAVILVYLDEAGQERRIRLHAQGGWTMTAAARRQNALADRLRMWTELPPERAPLVRAEAAGPAAFPVVGPSVNA